MAIVLVLDDDFVVLEVLAMALEGEGHRVLKASTADRAREILAAERCDVVIVDPRSRYRPSTRRR